MRQPEERKMLTIPRVEPVKFIERTNGTIKGYAVNTFHGMAKNYNEDRVSIIMNITKPNHKGRWPRCSYFGIFDGHGGNKCSDFLKENMHKYITENAYFPQEPIQALKFGFKKAEQQFISFAESQSPIQRSGSCAIVLLIIDEVSYVANVGDSRAILSTNLGKQVYSISKDHKPDSQTEKQRILAAGGKIYQSAIKHKNGQTVLGPFRIEPGKLSVSRSFGDIEAKLAKYDGNSKVLIAKPQITYFQINSKEHDFIIIGSDGVYDKLTNQQVVDCFWKEQREAIKKSELNSKTDYSFIGTAASKIIEKSMEKYSLDNLTSLLVVFEDNGRLLLPQRQINLQQKLNKNIDKEEENRIHLRNSKQKENRMNNRTQQPKEKQESIKLDKQKQKKSLSKQNCQSSRSSQFQLDKLISKRKSTTMLLNSLNQKRMESVLQSLSSQNNPGSMHGSMSTKLLNASSKVQSRINSNNSSKDDSKIPTLDTLNKKKSCQNIRKDKKESLWKQLTTIKQKSIGEKQKIDKIRF